MNHKKKGFLGSILMMACCIVPMLALLLFAPQLKAAGKSNYSWLIMLLCPLMHLLMMKGLMGSGESRHGTKKINKTQKKNRITGEQAH